MGVKDLIKLLKTKAPTAFRTQRPDTSFTDAWIDTPLTIMAHYKKCQSVGILPYQSIEDAMLRTITNFRDMGVERVHFVFDGRTRTEKISTVSTRIVAAAKYSTKTTPTIGDILKADLELCESIVRRRVSVDEVLALAETEPEPERQPEPKKAVASIPEAVAVEQVLAQPEVVLQPDIQRLMGFPSTWSVSFHTMRFLQSVSKANPSIEVHIAEHDSEEYIARHVSERGLVSSIDSDVLAFGIQNVVQYVGTPTETWICLDHVLEQMGLSLTQFRWMCVLLGTDFNSRLRGHGPAAILPVIKNPAFDIDVWGQKEGATQQWIADAKRSFNIFSLKT